MPKQAKVPPADRITPPFAELTVTAKEVKAAAAELNQALQMVEDALEELDMGVSAWHKVAGGSDENGWYWSREIGYTQIGSKWCIALKKSEGNHDIGEYEEEVLPFKKAPKWMCTESVGQIPGLLESLQERAKETVKKLKARAAEVREFGTAIHGLLKGDSSSKA
jgi:hypothetical protein